MDTLNTIQKKHQLNDVYPADDLGPGNAHHIYKIYRHDDDPSIATPISTIQFQCGPRSEEYSIPGVVLADLLEICRDQLMAFQTSKFATRENAIVLTHIEESLMWLNKRTEDRASKGTLGTNNV